MTTRVVHCPACKHLLLYCNGDRGQDYLYCPRCRDFAYDPEIGADLVIGVFS